MVADPVNRLRERWSSLRIDLNLGASDEVIASFERFYSVKLPEDWREYFAVINGMSGNGSTHWDENMVYFWPLPDPAVPQSYEADYQVVSPVSKSWSGCIVEGGTSLFTVADYCIHAHIYVVELGEHSDSRGSLYLLQEATPLKIADSFTEFVDGYLADPDRILWGG